MSEGETTANQYNAMAAEYSADNDAGVFNELYERPAMLAMLGELEGLRVLDAGCGAGPLTEEMCSRGASVVGLDVSSAMVEIAEQRLGETATFHVGDMHDPLPLANDEFDLVVASLVLHYLGDWIPVLQEFRRVLRPGGAIVLSTHHPTMDWKRCHPDDYFEKMQVTETWVKGGKPFDVTFWRRPLAEMSREIQAAGLRIDAIEEPMPTGAFDEADEKYRQYLTTHPHFLFLRLSAAV